MINCAWLGNGTWVSFAVAEVSSSSSILGHASAGQEQLESGRRQIKQRGSLRLLSLLSLLSFSLCGTCAEESSQVRVLWPALPHLRHWRRLAGSSPPGGEEAARLALNLSLKRPPQPTRISLAPPTLPSTACP